MAKDVFFQFELFPYTSVICFPDEGYKLTNSGYDYLALNTLSKRGIVQAIGSRVGCGKEAGNLFFNINFYIFFSI